MQFSNITQYSVRDIPVLTYVLILGTAGVICGMLLMDDTIVGVGDTSTKATTTPTITETTETKTPELAPDTNSDTDKNVTGGKRSRRQTRRKKNK